VLGLTVATTLVASLLMPKQYTATASVVVDFKPDPVSAMAFGGMAIARRSWPRRSTSSAATAWPCAWCAT
jgi:uncharacterized protein involved in exopolysaccharide biosynthesis